MNELIKEKLLKVKEKGFSNVELLALVTNSSYEVMFYAKRDDDYFQSNAMVEDGMLTWEFVDKIYNEVAHIIRNSKEYDPDKLNVVKVALDKEMTISYEERDSHQYKLKKEWKKSIGVN